MVLILMKITYQPRKVGQNLINVMQTQIKGWYTGRKANSIMGDAEGVCWHRKSSKPSRRQSNNFRFKGQLPYLLQYDFGGMLFIPMHLCFL